MTAHPSVSKKHISGHLRRAQVRVEKAMTGRSSQDMVIQAALGAAGAGLALRLLRNGIVSRLIGSVAPMIVFALLYSRSDRQARASH